MVCLPVPNVDPVLDDLADRGYETTRLDGQDTPAAVATGGDAPDAVTDRPLSVEPLATATPLELVARLAAAARDRRGTLFVADPATAAEARDILGAPFLRPGAEAGEDAERAPEGRGFYAIPDRIRLTDDTVAAVATDADLTWRTGRPGGVTGEETGDPPLLLESDGQVHAALDSVDALTCPGPDPDAFPARYVRGADRQIHVFDGDRELGTFTGVTAMRERGFQPVPLPLVPEHHLRTSAHLARRWLVATVDDGEIQYATA